jgi:prepilin-type N-terminal cleavage/methylation domain-containing protein
MKKTQGFTLIELLIASSILVMIMLVGTYSYSLFADKWNKQLGHVNEVAEQIRKVTLLDQLLDGIVPLVLTENNTNGFYFDGSADELKAISLNGIIRSDEAVIFRLSLDTLINGTKQIWYQEASVQDTLLLSAKQSIPFDEPLLLLGNLTQAQFSYFGWQNFEVKSQAAFENDLSKRPSWQPNYQGHVQQLHPEKLLLNLQFVDAQLSLNSRYTKNSEILLREFD